MKCAGECLVSLLLEVFAHILIHLHSSQVAVSLAQTGALSLVRALGSLSQTMSSLELSESVAEAIAAMSRFPDLHQRLILECAALSCLAPLCVEDVGMQRQEASLGIGFFCWTRHFSNMICASGTLALLCSCSGSIECSVNTALQVTSILTPSRSNDSIMSNFF